VLPGYRVLIRRNKKKIPERLRGRRGTVRSREWDRREQRWDLIVDIDGFLWPQEIPDSWIDGRGGHRRDPNYRSPPAPPVVAGPPVPPVPPPGVPKPVGRLVDGVAVAPEVAEALDTIDRLEAHYREQGIITPTAPEEREFEIEYREPGSPADDQPGTEPEGRTIWEAVLWPGLKSVGEVVAWVAVECPEVIVAVVQVVAEVAASASDS
jgi:hypothetical protein